MATPGPTTATEDRALKLLGSGIGPAQVAAALGVTEARISQLISLPEFAAQVAELRFSALSKHNDRDTKYDNMEDMLLERLENCLDFMVNPMQLLKAIQVINAAKRRGSASPEQITAQQTIIQLNIPSVILQKFTTNINNQVIQTGEQKLVTIQSSTILDKIKEQAVEPTGQVIENGPYGTPRSRATVDYT